MEPESGSAIGDFGAMTRGRRLAACGNQRALVNLPAGASRA
jgi:hypothetical protein